MAAFNDDNDLGAIAVAVITATVVIGGIIYAVSQFDPRVQIASRLPTTIEKTVPRIVPLQPQ